MPRYAHYNNRWWKTTEPTTLYPGTWITARQLGQGQAMNQKFPTLLHLLPTAGDRTAVEDGWEVSWTDSARLAAAIALHQPCAICLRRPRKLSPPCELLTYQQRLRSVREELQHGWSMKGTELFDDWMHKNDVYCICWRCLLIDDLGPLRFITKLRRADTNPAGLLALGKQLHLGCA